MYIGVFRHVGYHPLPLLAVPHNPQLHNHRHHEASKIYFHVNGSNTDNQDRKQLRVKTDVETIVKGPTMSEIRKNHPRTTFMYMAQIQIINIGNS